MGEPRRARRAAQGRRKRRSRARRQPRRRGPQDTQRPVRHQGLHPSPAHGQGCRREDRDYAGGNLADAGRVLKSLVGDLAVVVVLFDKRRCTREYGGRTTHSLMTFPPSVYGWLILKSTYVAPRGTGGSVIAPVSTVPAGWFHDQDASGDSGTTTNSP